MNDFDHEDGERRRLDVWKRALRGSSLAHTIDLVTSTLTAHETRKRARRPDDTANYRAAVDCLLCNLAHRSLTDELPVSMPAKHGLGRRARVDGPYEDETHPDSDGLRQPVTRKDRYRSPVLGKFLPELIETMRKAGYIAVSAAVGNPARPSLWKPQTIGATSMLVDIFNAHGVALEHIGRAQGEELILLRADKDDAVRAGELIDYADGELSHGFRAEMRALNEWLASADVSYVGPERVAVHERFLVRRFTCGDAHFGHGGRMWGGFWSELSKEQRHAGLRIQGEHIVGVDFREMVLRTVYAYAREVPPENGYLLDGPASVVPRKAVKKLTAACLFSRRKLTHWPGDEAEQRELREACAGLGLAEVRDAIETKHAAIASVFYRGIGHRTQVTESEIVLAAMAKLREAGVVALPVHDCVYVAASKETIAVQTLAETFERHLPLPAALSVETFMHGRVIEYSAWNRYHMTITERVRAVHVSDADAIPSRSQDDMREPPNLPVDEDRASDAQCLMLEAANF